jgi:hypothetical protein
MLKQFDDMVRLSYSQLRRACVQVRCSQSLSAKDWPLQDDSHRIDVATQDTTDTAADTDDEFFECETFDEG